MAKQSNQAAEKLGVTHEILRETALRIFCESGLGNNGYTAGHRAQRSFSLAAEFLREDNRILQGGDIDPVVDQVKAPKVLINKINPISEEVIVDENGNDVMLEVTGDPFAFAPNLKPNHPINQINYKARAELGMEPIDRRFERLQSDYARDNKIKATS